MNLPAYGHRRRSESLTASREHDRPQYGELRSSHAATHLSWWLGRRQRVGGPVACLKPLRAMHACRLLHAVFGSCTLHAKHWLAHFQLLARLSCSQHPDQPHRMAMRPP